MRTTIADTQAVIFIHNNIVYLEIIDSENQKKSLDLLEWITNSIKEATPGDIELIIDNLDSVNINPLNVKGTNLYNVIIRIFDINRNNFGEVHRLRIVHVSHNSNRHVESKDETLINANQLHLNKRNEKKSWYKKWWIWSLFILAISSNLLIQNQSEPKEDFTNKCVKLSGEYSGVSYMGKTTGIASLSIDNDCNATLSYHQHGFGGDTEYGRIIYAENKYKFDRGNGNYYDLYFTEKEVILEGYSWKCILERPSLPITNVTKVEKSDIKDSSHTNTFEIIEPFSDIDIKFNGYYRAESIDVIRLMKFFPEGRVVTINGTKETEHDLHKFLSRETSSEPSFGLHNVIATVRNDSIFFTIHPEKGDIDFRGKVSSGSSLSFERYSHINGHREQMEYFFQPDSLPS
jgi:hypothetical protein